MSDIQIEDSSEFDLQLMVCGDL